MNVAKSLKQVNEALSSLIADDGDNEPVEKTLTLKEFIAYAKEQLAKAVDDEDPGPRLAHLATQIEKAMGFDDGDGVAFSVWADSELSASGQTAMADKSNMHGAPPGARPDAKLPAAGISTASAPGSFDDAGTNPAPAPPNTTPGGNPMPAPADGASKQGFDDGSHPQGFRTAKSADGWELDLASPSFLDKKANNVEDHLDFGPDVRSSK